MWIIPEVILSVSISCKIRMYQIMSVLQVTGVSPSPRGGIACAAVNGTKFVIFGGSDREPSTFDDVWVLETGY
jgi:hypothetical protein